MDGADADHAAGLQQAHALHDRQRVIVPVPDVHALVAERLRDLFRVPALDGEGHGRDALVQSVHVRDAVDPGPGHGLDGMDQRPGKLVLIFPNDRGCLFEGQPPAGVTCILPQGRLFASKLISQPFKIFQCPEHACNAFMVLRAGLEFIRQLIRSRANLVGLQFVKQVISSI